MKKKLALLLSTVLLIALIVVPAQAADTVYNLIDENGATWSDVELNNNAPSHEFKDGNLIATAPGPWPYVEGVFNTPIEIDPNSEAVVNTKFSIENNGSAINLQLVCGSEVIALHQFAGDDKVYASSGDLNAGEYEYSVKVSDLKMYDGNAENQYMGRKDLVLTDGKLVITGVKVWCAGVSDIKITVEKLEIVVPGEDETSEAGETQIVNLAAGKSYTLFGLYKDGEGNIPYPDESGKDLTDGIYATEAAYGDVAFVGFNVGAPDMVENDSSISEVVVDLESKETLTKFVLETVTQAGSGITAPSEIKVYVSDDSESWSEVGTMSFDGDTSVDGLYTATLEESAEGRYVKFASEHDQNWVFISEVEVYGESDGSNPQTSDYGFIGFALVAMISLSGIIVVSRKRA